MTTADPWSGVNELLVDGNNLLHRISGGPDPAARRLLVSRLRAALPREVTGPVILDGMPDAGGLHGEKIAPNLFVRHAGRMTADQLIVELVDGAPFADRAGMLVVSDDRALGDRVRRAGGLVRRLDWLQSLLLAADRGVAPPRGDAPVRGSTVGRRRGPALPNAADAGRDAGEDARPPWSPGRGATRKRGNPRRAGRSAGG